MAKKLLQKKHSFIVSVILLYILLFEFVLPSNPVLPKPSEIYGAFISLISDYDLVISVLFSLSVVVGSIFITLLLNKIFAPHLVNIVYKFEQLQTINSGAKYIPLFLFPLLIIFWFGNELWAEYIFGMFICSSFIKKEISDNIKKVPQEYLEASISLKIDEKKIYSEVVWKSILPSIRKNTTQLFLQLWLMITVYEFIAGTQGIGEIYRSILEYSDFPALITLSILFGFLLWGVDKLLTFVINKIIYWD